MRIRQTGLVGDDGGMTGRAIRVASTRLFWRTGDPFVYPYEVDLYFDDLGVRVALGEGVAHGAHGGVFTVIEALAPHWVEHLRKAGAEWLRPYLERMVLGEQVPEREIVDHFVRLHGRAPDSSPLRSRGDHDDLAARIALHPRGSLTGSIAVWGAFRGRPFDDSHAILAAGARMDGSVRIELDGDESLIIWRPEGFAIGADGLTVERAERVRREILAPDLSVRSFQEYTVTQRDGSALLQVANERGQLLDRGDPGDAPALRLHSW